jgi:hypothetical protein
MRHTRTRRPLITPFQGLWKITSPTPDSLRGLKLLQTGPLDICISGRIITLDSLFIPTLLTMQV